MSDELTLAVIAKEPVPGSSKTRLSPECSPEEAARLALAALSDTLAVLAATPATRRVVALDGRPGPWLPDGFDVLPQVSGTLDLRIAGLFADVDGPLVLVGMDTPQITPELLSCDFGTYPAWLGPAEDGGFWLIGLAQPDPTLVRGVPMSVPETYAAQHRRLVDAGLEVGDLPLVRDVDTWADAQAVAAIAPDTRFGRTFAELGARRPGASPARSDEMLDDQSHPGRQPQPPPVVPRREQGGGGHEPDDER